MPGQGKGKRKTAGGLSTPQSRRTSSRRGNTTGSPSSNNSTPSLTATPGSNGLKSKRPDKYWVVYETNKAGRLFDRKSDAISFKMDQEGGGDGFNIRGFVLKSDANGFMKMEKFVLKRCGLYQNR